MIEFDEKWAPTLRSSPETGMGYTVCRVELVDGRVFDRVVITGGMVTRCDGSADIPFEAEEVAKITPTHDKSALS